MTNLTSFVQFFSVSVRLFDNFLLWLTGHGHGVAKTGPKTVTGLDFQALDSTIHIAYDTIIHSMSSMAQDHVSITEVLISQVVEVL